MKDKHARKGPPVIIAGIGASTLTSLKRLFSTMSTVREAAFVLIRHAEAPQQEITIESLQAITTFPVVEAADGMPVISDRIHLMPSGKLLDIAGGLLTFHEPVECTGLPMPIDHFLCSLAIDQGRLAVGILLSGTGSDGIMGLSQIRAKGGNALVEAPSGGELSEAAARAIDADAVDAVLSAESMGETLSVWMEQVLAEGRNNPELAESRTDLDAILELLLQKGGHDFRGYKTSTIIRRIRRRMALATISSFPEYVRFLSGHPQEVARLKKDLLIGVTEFFRQPAAWKFLAEHVVSALAANAGEQSGIRVWIPGCSTGKEAYSIAMLIWEQMEAIGRKVPIQIFATDSDTAALAIARSGSYSEQELGANVSSERRKRFFTHLDGRWRIAKEIREQVVLAPQNLTTDPPFSRLDLVICRNLLIYLEPDVQKKVISLFHFALREGGFLFLGSAETIGDREDLFSPLSKKMRIYRRIGVRRALGLEIPVHPSGAKHPAAAISPAAPIARMSLAAVAQQALLERFSPACVMIDRKLRVLYVHGRIEDYLTIPKGELTTHVVDMAREGLRVRLRGAITKCVETNRPVSATARVLRLESSVPVKIAVSPLRHPREADGLMLITFENHRLSTAKPRRKGRQDDNVLQLEDELKVTREELQSTIEQFESSNDLLKASNEEVTAANEELQSANEELETSKEELQSLNEELNTINARLQEKVEELESARNDVVNLLSSTNIATVFLDKELRIKRYTPASTRLLSLIPSDVGRPVADVLRRFEDDSLIDDSRRVLAELAPSSKEVHAEGDRFYIRRITPYRTQDDRIEGVVTTFVDITERKQAEEALRESELQVRRKLEAILSPDGDIGSLDLGDIINVESIQSLMDDFYQLAKVPMSIIDLEGKVLVGVGWQDICTRFHRAHPDTCRHCIESDTQLSAGIAHRESRLYKCKNNMWDIATPILVGGKHMGNIFSGQFFFEGEIPDYDLFRSQARRYGFDEGAYIAAMEAVPRLSRQTVDTGMSFFMKLADKIAKLSYANIKLARSLAQRDTLMESLNESREDLKRAQAVAKTGSWRLDVRNNELIWSDETYRMFGIPRETRLTYETFLSAVHPEDREYVDRNWLAALNGKPYDIEHRIMAGETVKWVREKAELEFGEQAGLLGGFGTVQDITQRKNSEKKVLRQNAILSGINRIFQETLTTRSDEALGRTCLSVAEEVTQSPFGFIGEIGPDGLLHDTAMSETGWELCAMVDKTGHRRPPGDFKIHGLYGRVLKDGASLLTNRPTAHPGSIGVPHGHAPLHAFLGVPLIRDGVTIGIIAMSNRKGGYTQEDQEALESLAPAVVEAFSRKRAEEALGRAKEKLETTLDSITGGYYALDAGWLFAEANHAAEKYFGRPRDELVGRMVWDLIASPSESMIYRKFHEAIENRKPVHFEAQSPIRPDVWSEMHLYPRDGLLEVYFTDISERKQMETELRRSKDELETRVQERTIELKRRADQLSLLASELTLTEERERRRLAEILHDHLQQLLVGAKLNLESLSTQVAYDQQQAFKAVCNLLMESIETSRSLTAELSPPILYQRGLTAALKWLARWMQQKYDLDVKLHVEEEIGITHEDIMVLIFQSVRELLFNVVKHAQVKAAEVHMLRQDPEQLRIVVSDLGAGFDPSRMWEQSEQACGFGMFTIRERLELLGGRLEVKSAPGQGASFTLIAPLGKADPVEKKAVTVERRKKVRAIVSPTVADKIENRIRVLLADDHIVMRQGLSTMLNGQSDIEIVAEAADGEAAVQLAHKLKPDVILMDISMPKMNGIEATRILRAELPQIRIICLSMFDDSDIASAVLKAGASVYLSKTGSTDALLRAIRGEGAPE